MNQAVRPSGRRWWVLGVLTLSQLMVVLDVTIVNIALPSIQADLEFPDEGRHWLVTGYALSFGSLLLIGGRLSDYLGRRRMLVLGLSGFALASAVAGFASSFETLLIARVLQGAFGALLAPAALSLVSATFEDRRSRIRAFSIFGAVSSGGGAVGLLLGGVLTEFLSWHWSMFVNLPIAALAFAGIRLIAKDAAVSRNRLDVPGALTSATGIVAVVFGLGNAEQGGWWDLWTIAPLAIGLALLLIFALVERRSDNPLLPLRVILDRNRGAANLVGFLVNGGLFGVFLFSTYFFTEALGYSPLTTGLSFVPVILSIVASSTLVGSRRVGNFGPRLLITMGAGLSVVGLVMLTGVEASSDFVSDLLPGLVVYGLGLGMVFGRLQEAATARAERRDIGVASAMINASQEIGGAAGIALTSSLAAGAAAAFAAAATPSATLATAVTAESFHAALWVAVGLYALAAIVALLVFRSGTIEVDPNAEPLVGH